MIGPAVGVLPETLIAAVRDELTNVLNLRGTPGTGFDRFMAYLRWSNDAVLRLATMVRPRDLQLLVTSERYWILQALDPATRADTLGGFVDLEIGDRARVLRASLESLEWERNRWQSRRGALVIADTNVFVHHEREFTDLPWSDLVYARDGVHLVIPILVVDELDNLKRSGKEAVRTRARVTLRRLDELVRPEQLVTLQPPSGFNGAVTAELLSEEVDHVRLTRADSELAGIALDVQRVAGRPVTVITSDVGMKYRCESAGLAVIRVET